MSNIKQFFDKDGNDIFPVTHASAVFDDNGKSILETLQSASYVSVKDYGAKGDGVTDDTKAINDAIANNSYIVFPPGKYLITAPIFIGFKKEVRGFGDHSTIITNTSIDIFHIGYRCTIDGLRVETWECPEYNANVITINESTLREWVNSEGNAALKTRIKNISVRSGNSGVNSSVITLSMSNKVNDKFDGFLM